MDPAAPRPTIRLLALGGTIASAAAGGFVEPNLSAGELLRDLPQAQGLATFEPVDYPPVPSFDVTAEVMLDAARQAHRARRDGAAAVLITHGTDTLEETAYFLALTVPRTIGIVLTGAMRNPTMAGNDGPANLLGALRVAADARIAAHGPVAVLGDEIHAARWVAKVHSTRPSALQSPGAGPVGEVVEDRVHLWHGPVYEDHLGLPDTHGALDVRLVGAHSGMGAAALAHALAGRPDGIVLQGTGGGHLPTTALPALDAVLSAGVPVVVATGTVGGRNLQQTYGMAGGEVDLIARGAVPAGGLSARKARLRLLVALALGREHRAVFPVA